MSVNNPYQAYKQNTVNTAPPGELTLMLYNGCLKFISAGKQAMKNGDVNGKNENLKKAQDIIQELMVTLNTDISVAANMMQMYDYIHRRLIEANVQNDVEVLEEAEGYVVEFRDTWKAVLKITQQQKAVNADGRV
ncbi:flagellar export chaperone FliS [Massilibacterium senegalense]|uniref:flagellar export chaperone FliS n=1 Tax=Massilibacterium senegalense TaxID=1632858 RepID=UPI0007807B56|nr:flagellar export chaperone FliS [Massilibacterium senegalense]